MSEHHTHHCHLVFGGKGGIGKTFFSLELYDYLKYGHVMPWFTPRYVHAIDLDSESRSFARYISDAQQRWGGETAELDQLICAFGDRPLEYLVADIGGGRAQAVIEWLEDGFAVGARSNISFTLWCCVSRDLASQQNIQEWLSQLPTKLYGDRLRIRVVKNNKDGKVGPIPMDHLYKGGFNFGVLEIPSLPFRLMSLLDKQALSLGGLINAGTSAIPLVSDVTDTIGLGRALRLKRGIGEQLAHLTVTASRPASDLDSDFIAPPLSW